uniref:Aquaporin-7 n=1 Tax=Oncorhynchus mykiss TaxID=8022 RepID=A0A8K9WZJ4_ONCMY
MTWYLDVFTTVINDCNQFSHCGRLFLTGCVHVVFIFKVFGLGSVAQVVTGRGAFGEYLSVNLGFGLGVAMGMHIGGRVSGAHMNAAVSFSMCLFGRLGWRMLPVYILCQLIGSFLAAGTIYSLYYDAIYHYCGGNLTVSGPKATAGIFATYPAPYLSLPAGFLDQVIGTAMLLLCLMALSDQRNQPAPSGSEPIAVGLLVLLIGVSLGSNSGYAINPSRDLGPRIFTAIAGWGPEVFRCIKKAHIEYPFEHGGVINYTIQSVSIHPVTKKIQVSFLTQLPERKVTAQGFHHEANGDFKLLQSLMAVIREDCRWNNNIVVIPQY